MRCDRCNRKVLIVYDKGGSRLCQNCLHVEESFLEEFKKQVDAVCNSVHHIFPSSRGRKWTRNGRNKVFINSELHEKLHSLMLNRNPYEILDFLVEYFWGGRLEIVRNYLERKEKQIERREHG